MVTFNLGNIMGKGYNMLNNLLITNSTKVTFSMVIEMVLELYLFILMKIFTKVPSKKASFMGRENLNIRMGHFTMGTGSMGKNMEKDSIK